MFHRASLKGAPPIDLTAWQPIMRNQAGSKNVPFRARRLIMTRGGNSQPIEPLRRQFSAGKALPRSGWTIL